MEKLLQVIIVCALLGMLLIGCGKSEGVIACEKIADEIASSLAGLGDGADEDVMKKRIEQGCSSYEGGTSAEEVQKWLFRKAE
jgi:hypothetical protein